ncbi:MAG: ATP-binding protein [Spirochaetes bacterium]|nr:MAG: ATP-binding protein [Spirochaetota bacterium]
MKYCSLERSHFISFEDVDLKVLFEEDIKVFARLHVEPHAYLFIDEFQYAREGGKQLKYLYDTYPGKKIIISGSSAADLTVEAVKFLAGRIFLFTLLPFSYGEFLRAVNPDLHALFEGMAPSAPISEPVHKQLIAVMRDYLRYGGYPHVITASSDDEKREVLKNLVNVLLLRDIRDVSGIADETVLYKLLRLLAFQTGSMASYTELANASGLRDRRVREHLAAIEKTFVLRQVYPFFSNPRTEIVKNPKIYYLDIGLRNAVMNDFRGADERADRGALVENFVLTELLKNGRQVKYYRSKSQAEVDFILDERLPVEVKATPVKGVSRSYRAFVDRYAPERGYVLSTGPSSRLMVKDCVTHIVPAYLAGMIE